MTSGELILLIIISVIGFIFIMLGVLFLLGKGAFLIAGYNTMSKEEKAAYDEKKLTQFIGTITLPIGLTTPLVAIGGIYHLTWMIWLYVVIVVGLSVFAIIYTNTKNRFKKTKDEKHQE